MANDPADVLPGRPAYGVWRLDNLDTSLCNKPKRLPSASRVRLHGTVGKIGDHHNIVRAWLILGIFGTSAGATGVVWLVRASRGW